MPPREILKLAAGLGVPLRFVGVAQPRQLKAQRCSVLVDETVLAQEVTADEAPRRAPCISPVREPQTHRRSEPVRLRPRSVSRIASLMSPPGVVRPPSRTRNVFHSVPCALRLK